MILNLALADNDDVPSIVDLMNRAYRGQGATSGWTDEVRYLAGDRITVPLLTADLARKPGASLLKWQHSSAARIQGCVWLEPMGAGVWYLGSFTVDPDDQGLGIGRVMLAAAEDWAREQGAERLRITVISLREELIAWYRRRGYIPTGETLPFPYDNNAFGVPLRDDLTFTMLEKNVKGPPA